MTQRTIKVNRPMGDYNIIQRAVDGMFNASDLLKQWNSNPNNKKKSIAEIVRTDYFHTFANTLVKRKGGSNLMIDVHQSLKPNGNDGSNLMIDVHQSLNPNGNGVDNQDVGMIDVHQSLNEYGIPSQLMFIKRGRRGRNATEDQVWMDPHLFMKFAMSLNPEFEVDVVMFVTDQLIYYRNKVADMWREWNAMVARFGGSDADTFKRLARCLNKATFGYHEEGMRDFATSEELQEMARIQAEILQLIKLGYINNLDGVIKHLKKYYKAHKQLTIK